MQPLTAHERARILDEHPDVTEEDINEYDELLVHRAGDDPSAPETEERLERRLRLERLHRKLYPYDLNMDEDTED